MSNFISQFPTCPRCKIDWIAGDDKDKIQGYNKACHQCGMRMGMTSIDCVLRLVVEDKWIVYWYLNRGCSINKANTSPNHMTGFVPFYEGKVIISHWLPFDITGQRIKLLLLFS